MGPPPRTSLPMRMTASWSDLGSTEYKVVVRSHAGRSPLGLFARTSLSSAMPNGPNRKDPMSSRPAARLAPCSMLSRTLRAGVAGAASGILDSPLRAALCRRQVGTKGWPLAVEPRDGPRKEGRKKVPRPRIFSLDSGSPIQGRRRRRRVRGCCHKLDLGNQPLTRIACAIRPLPASGER
jgi:hypothetical protein